MRWMLCKARMLQITESETELEFCTFVAEIVSFPATNSLNSGSITFPFVCDNQAEEETCCEQRQKLIANVNNQQLHYCVTFIFKTYLDICKFIVPINSSMSCYSFQRHIICETCFHQLRL